MDFGSIICRGTDEFELVIKHRACGPIFYCGNRDIENLGERNKFDQFQFTKVSLDTRNRARGGSKNGTSMNKENNWSERGRKRTLRP